jgi:hypothetical protein
LAVLNLDMVGEDQALCGSPFTVERCPDFRPDLLTPLAEQAVAQVFEATRSQGGVWRSAPFMGFSDHALFAAQELARPAVQLCHVPDRFNHSAADTLDKVSPLEMQRSMAAAATICELLIAPEHLPRSQLSAIVDGWCAAEQRQIESLVERYAGQTHDGWANELRAAAAQQAHALRLLASGSAQPDATTPPAGTRALFPRFSGPFNARGMTEELSPASRRALSEMVRTDKLSLAMLSQLALRADGRLTRNELLQGARLALRKPFDAGKAEQLLSWLLEASWLTEKEIEA